MRVFPRMKTARGDRQKIRFRRSEMTGEVKKRSPELSHFAGRRWVTVLSRRDELLFERIAIKFGMIRTIQNSFQDSP